MESRSRWVDLVATAGTRKASITVITLSFFQRLSGISCLLAYTSVTLPKTGGGLSPDMYMVLFGIMLTVANFACLPLIDRLGRRPLLMISTTALFFVQGTTGVFYGFHDSDIDSSSFNWVPYLNLIQFGFWYSFAIGIVPSTLLGEMFPANVRSKAAGVVSVFFAISSFSINKTYLWVGETFGIYVMFVFFALMNAFTTFFVFFYCIETKGKTLGEIQDLLNNR